MVFFIPLSFSKGSSLLLSSDMLLSFPFKSSPSFSIAWSFSSSFFSNFLAISLIPSKASLNSLSASFPSTTTDFSSFSLSSSGKRSLRALSTLLRLLIALTTFLIFPTVSLESAFPDFSTSLSPSLSSFLTSSFFLAG
ncbi:hypothetical protein ES705_41135 [subsurface metagenome]